MGKHIGAIFLLVLFAVQISAQTSQIYPDTIRVPVTFYDFHSDRTNPEFEPRMDGTRHLNMVADTLDKDKKPVLGSSPYLDYYIKYWFRDWNSSAKGDFKIPLYTPRAGYKQRQLDAGGNPDWNWEIQPTITYMHDTTISTDTSFINKVIQDTLLFAHKGNGVYQYKNDLFFPLDNKGFGKEWNFAQGDNSTHNYSFTMELHWRFTKIPGMTFSFTGDDDVFAFIKNHKVMEIGGIHQAISDSFSVDSLKNLGLVDGNDYDFDFFYAERHSTDSHIRITTNIITAHPSHIYLTVKPDSTIHIGDTLKGISTVTDQNDSIRPDFSKQTTWRFINSSFNSDTTIKPTPHTSDTIRFIPTDIGTVTIEGTVTNGSGGYLRDTITIHVLPGPPDHLVIEALPPPFTGSNLRDDNPLAFLQLPSSTSTGRAYAIIRDKYGNFIEASQLTTWSILTGSDIIANVANGDQTKGEGIVTKKGPPGAGSIAAQSGAYPGAKFKDTLTVKVDSTSYDALRISVSTTKQTINNLIISTDQCTLLVAEAHRLDGLGWDPVPGNWHAFKSSNSAPQNSQAFDYCPADTGKDTIKVSYTNLLATLPVTITPGGPARIEIWSSANGSHYSDPPASYTDSAGEPFQLYAKVFDKHGVWLNKYDNYLAPIQWSIKEVSGTPPTGSLTSSSGNTNSFIPTKAPNKAMLIATFTQSTNVFSDSVLLQIIPGAPDHITIQPDTSSIQNWTDLSSLDFQSKDTTKNLYSIIRDKYDNFISYAEQALWNSRDSGIIKAASSTNPFYGGGILTRATDQMSYTWVIAQSQDLLFKDSLRVNLTNITYDSLWIYKLENPDAHIDTVKIRVDESDTLYVKGKRSDGKGWDNVAAAWSINGSLRVVGTPPTSSDHWNIIPDTIGTGQIIVSRAGSVPDTVVVMFIPGTPNSMSIYNAEGNPTLLTPYPASPRIDTLTAGTAYPLVAKIFDGKNNWLSGYENPSVSKNLFTWKIDMISGSATPDTLSSRTGYKVSFLPTRAYSIYKITTEFKEGTNTLTSIIQFYIQPGPITHLVIEQSPSPLGIALNLDSPYDPIEFQSKESIKNAYAILRDAYGNYVDRSQNTAWSSFNDSIAKATEGVIKLGEGVVQRIGTTGITRIVAFYRTNPSLVDTVSVDLSAFSYDSLRIVVRDSIRIDSLTMRSDQDTTLQVIGKLSFGDNIWMPVSGNWQYQSTGTSMSSPSSMTWKFAPGDTGNGKIIVSRGTSVPDTIVVKILPGLPYKLVLYPKAGPVPDPSNLPFPDPSQKINDTAGQKFPMTAKIFDHKNVYLADYEIRESLGRQIKWSVVEQAGNVSTGILSDTSGSSQSYLPLKAYRSVYIIARLDQDASHEYSDTVQLNILPGKAKNLFIEQSPNWQSSPTIPNPVDTVAITDSMVNISVYAILRDSLGNYVKYADVRTWGVVKSDTIISVRSGNTNLGEGVIERMQREGEAGVFAIDANGLRDTVGVKLLPYYYKQLRILVKNDTNATLLRMTTNDDTLLQVQGYRSDSLIWVDVSAKWEFSQSVAGVLSNPGRTHSWTCSPTDTAHGWIRVTMDNDAVTKPDTLNVIFDPGKPTHVKIDIITQKDKLIAGEPITAVVTITNNDGKTVPGLYCFKADSGNGVKYSDNLEIKNGYKPFVILNGDTVFLSDTGSECFQSGVDTVFLTLFNAPSNPDSLHKISLHLGNLNTESKPFSLLPGALDAISIENPDGTPAKDTIVIKSPDGSFTVISVGYDRFGNKIGPVAGNWSTDSTLHKIPKSDNVSRIYYDAINATDNESGNLSVVAVNSTKKLSEKVFVEIVGPLATLAQAFTRDLNGNGYIDHIELHFNKPVNLPKGSFTIPGLRIHYGQTEFTLDSIIGAGRIDSVWILAIKEDSSQNKPQTDWEPFISFNEMSALGISSVSEKKITDGAGPVIWEVTKQIKGSGTDRSNDIVTVVFSEPIQRASDGSDLTGSDKPSSIFYVWERDTGSSNNFKLVDSILIGINAITPNNGSLTFVTSNNVDISSRYYFSLKSSDSAFITDKVGKGNPPVPVNQKVRVKVIGSTPKLFIYPNPAKPSFVYVPAGKLYAKNEPAARDWAKEGGAAFGFSMTLPDGKSDTVKCYIKIYDAVGNLVASAYTPNLLESIPEKASDSSSTYNVVMYWNGSNDNQMKVAPGVYMTVVYLNYSDPQKYKDCRMVGFVGIRN